MKYISLKYTWFSLLLVVLLTFAMPSVASDSGAKKFIDVLSGQVVDIATNNKLSDKEKDAKFRVMFSKNIDFDWIGNFVLGKHKRKANAAQKTRYIKAYKAFIISSYSKRFKNYAGEKFNIKSTRSEGNGKYLLTTEIIRKNAATILVDYKVKQVGNSYKIYDIVVEGVSLITTQRSEFNSVILRKGLDFLVKQLEKKAAA